jgi:2-polyprenyl-3-methyl-5-hydroxy-6-metoxy-1,4-benzoquinol methylase
VTVETHKDKAGREYWDKSWSTPLPKLLDLGDGRLSNYVNLRLHALLSEILGTRVSGQRLLEVGCARSVWLPYFAKTHGMHVTGLDYSRVGCRQEEILLQVAGVQASVVCSDLFSPDPSLVAAFDWVVTFGVVEHFTDTAACVSALGRFLRPYGSLITVIPNMKGVNGFLQKLFDRKVYDLHVPLTANQLYDAHIAAGLLVQRCDYFLSTNFSVVNTDNQRYRSGYIGIRLVHGLLRRLSVAIWAIERQVGHLRSTPAFSPYVICVATRSD